MRTPIPQFCTMLVGLAVSTLAQDEIDFRQRQSPVKNQGGRGTCTAFAVAAALESFPGVPHDLSEQMLYALTKQSDYEDGLVQRLTGKGEDKLKAAVGPGLALEAYTPVFKNYGVTYEEVLPYNPDSVRASVALQRAVSSDAKGFAKAIYGETQLTEAQRKLIKGMSKYRVLDHEIIDFYPHRTPPIVPADGPAMQQKTQQLIMWLRSGWADGHQAIPITYLIDAAAWSRYALSERVPVFDSVAAGATLGGHAVTIVGYTRDITRFDPAADPKLRGKEYFMIKNSWGPHWGGMGGYGFVSLDYHRKTALQAMLVKQVAIGGNKIEDGVFKTQPFFEAADIHLRVDLTQAIKFETQANGRPGISKRRSIQLSTYVKELVDPEITAARYAIEWRAARVQPDTRVAWGPWRRIESPRFVAPEARSGERDQSFRWKVWDEQLTAALVQFALSGYLGQFEMRVVVGFERQAMGLRINEAGRYYRVHWSHAPLTSQDIGGGDAIKLNAAATKALLKKFP